jgi:transcriptional/translational regulatory protein YebC/TACO1
VLDAGADDLQDDGDNWEVLSTTEAFPAVREAVKQLGIEPASAQVAMIPQNRSGVRCIIRGPGWVP